MTAPVGCHGDVPTRSLIVVNTDAVQLQVTVSMIGAGRVDTVFITDHLPELKERERRFYFLMKKT